MEIVFAPIADCTVDSTSTARSRNICRRSTRSISSGTVSVLCIEDRLGLIVDAEWNARKSNHLQRLIRQATFSDPAACLENVEYLPDRKLKKEELLRLGTCNYIHEHHNVILLGATGSGKTYLACALGMAAARQFLAVKYVRLPDLLVEFSIARGNGTIRKLMIYSMIRARMIVITVKLLRCRQGQLDHSLDMQWGRCEI